MGILSILSRNSAHGPRTRLPQDEVPCPAGFRGMLAHDAARCTGCRTCTYVCSPGAITLAEADPLFLEWMYFAGQCTFCGRCVEYCPTHALTCEETVPPVAADSSAHRVTHQVAYQPCPRCGRPVIPLPLQTLRAVYGDPVPESVTAQHSLCERCRGKTAAGRLRSMFGAGDHE